MRFVSTAAAAACLVSTVLVVGEPASALSCAGVRDWRSDTVFVGTVAEQGKVDDRGGEYRLVVDEVWRGQVPSSVWITYRSLYPDPFPSVGTAYAVALYDGAAVSNCSIYQYDDHAADARPSVVRPPDDLGWWELLWWYVDRGLEGPRSPQR